MLKIVHISDLHIDSPKFKFSHKNLISALIEDLDTYIDDKTLVVFSGDFLNEGGRKFSKDENPYDTVVSFLEEITNNYPILKNKIFLSIVV